MSDTGVWIPEDPASREERLNSALRQLYALRCTPPPAPDQPTCPDGPTAGGPFPEAVLGLATLLMQLAAITRELEASDDSAEDPAAQPFLAEVSHGLGHATRAAMTLLVSYRTEDGTDWKQAT